MQLGIEATLRMVYIFLDGIVLHQVGGLKIFIEVEKMIW